MSEDTPLIYTSHGNLPIDSLEYKAFWEDHQDLAVSLDIVDNKLEPRVKKDGYMNFIEEYWLDDECVKRAVHVYKFAGFQIGAEHGTIN